MGVDITKYNSHSNKFLHVHLKNVATAACSRSKDKVSLLIELASIFHDLGKINPQFQKKLKNPFFTNYKGYSYEYTQHAYLSAIAWLCFSEENRHLISEILRLSDYEVIGLAALIAHHHGDLPNLGTNISRIFNDSPNHSPKKQLTKFLESVDDLTIPISEYLKASNLLPNELIYNHFNLVDFDQDLREELLNENLYEKVEKPLELFQNLQFAFSCLVESDKRDAAGNEEFKKAHLSETLISTFANNLQQKFLSIAEEASRETNEKKRKLDAVRTEMRETAIVNLREFLKDERQRVFTLSAPTGAGKTLMLLNLAKEILSRRQDLSVIYALPFLAITEQTEKICKDIFKNDELVLRVDSKSENRTIQKLQEELDDNPDDEKVKKLLQEMFSAETFDHPFIITTFVQVFETLVSNRNSKLLRLPNFSKTIFLLDEIQALPPSLYTFFVAYLDEFCRKFDSYAIVSTATMPNLDLPDECCYKEIEKPSKVFRNYFPPKELLSEEFYFREEFNRYRIIPKYEIQTIDDLKDEVEKQEKSCLVVLNTIKDTKELFAKINNVSPDCHYVLLNTHFTLEDRQEKLLECRQLLDEGRKVVLISTQLIEAGVDIDFPIVFRDMCPLPNLIQTAGRCNRNNLLDNGKVFLFELTAETGKTNSASLIYNRNYDWFLNFSREEIEAELFEKDILPKQKKFATEKISKALKCGEIKLKGKDLNLVQCINEIRFEDFGKVKLIDEDYGFQLRYYVNRSDGEFEKLQRLVSEGKLISPREFAQIKIHRETVVEPQLKKMASRIVTVRVSEAKAKEAMQHLGSSEECCGIYLISSESHYDKIKGLILSVEGGEIV